MSQQMLNVDKTRLCRWCGEPFNAKPSNRLYCLSCRPPGEYWTPPPGGLHKPKAPPTERPPTIKYSPQQLRWIEARSYENLIQFFSAELGRVHAGESITRVFSAGIRHSLRLHGVTEGGGGGVTLTPQSRKHCPRRIRTPKGGENKMRVHTRRAMIREALHYLKHALDPRPLPPECDRCHKWTSDLRHVTYVTGEEVNICRQCFWGCFYGRGIKDPDQYFPDGILIRPGQEN